MSDQEKHSYQSTRSNKAHPHQVKDEHADYGNSQDKASLSPLKRARLFQSHITRDNLSQSDIAKKYNKSLAYISNTLRLLKLPEVVLEGLESETISEGHARALVTIPTKKEIVALYREILITSLSVRAVEKRAREIKKKV